MNKVEAGITAFLVLLGAVALATTVTRNKNGAGVIDALGSATSSNLLAAQGK
jgi:hypothetical protein